MANDDDDDDYLVEVPTKICKLDKSLDEAEVCIICLEQFTVNGSHKIVSIRCGHVFGQKCIENWFNNTIETICPVCKGKCSKKDIRPLFLNVKAVKLEDNEELCQKTTQLIQAQKDLKEIGEDCSKLRLMNKLLSVENDNLSLENQRLLAITDLAAHQQKSTQIDPSARQFTPKSGINFQSILKLQISAIGGCRVMAYSQIDNKICISCPSSNHVVTGFGVRIVDLGQGRVKKFLSLHSMMIRNLAFNSSCSTSLMLSCSLDKSLKMSSIHNDSVVSSYSCSHPIWSCAWSDNNTIVYAGLSNGNIEEIDTRKLSSPISTITTQSGGPVLSMTYVPANKHFKARGLLVTKSLGINFLRKPESSQSEGLSDYQLDTLLMSSTYSSPLMDTAFNQHSYHLLNTFRPTASTRNVRYLFSAVGSRINETDAMYASDVKSLAGSRSLDFMTRSCFISGTGSSSVNLAAAANEEMGAVRVWNLNSNFDYLDLFPKDVSSRKPVLDLCQYSWEPASFAAVNCDNLYLYKQFE